MTDGPFVESKEAIGGYVLLKADSLDEAVRIAEEAPSLRFGGKVEVRAIGECPVWKKLAELRKETAAAAV